MGETKFTPGPWKWEYNNLVSEAEGLNYGSRYVIELHEGTIYSEYSSDGAKLDITEANARLIAAAPALYEALKDARRLLDEIDLPIICRMSYCSRQYLRQEIERMERDLREYRTALRIKLERESQDEKDVANAQPEKDSV